MQPITTEIQLKLHLVFTNILATQKSTCRNDGEQYSRSDTGEQRRGNDDVELCLLATLNTQPLRSVLHQTSTPPTNPERNQTIHWQIFRHQTPTSAYI